MEIDAKPTDRKRSSRIIDGVSILIVVLVAVLLSMPEKLEGGAWTKQLPHVIGSVNSLTTLILVFGLISVKTGSIRMHRYAMTTAFALGVVFLISYVTYHLTNPASKFGGGGIMKGFYLAILASHILFSLVVLPLVLRAMFFAVTGQFERHKRIVKYAYPIWLYVSATGVAVYLLVHQFYPET